MFASYTQYISLVSLSNYFALSPAKCAICEMVTCSYISSVVCENKQLFYFFCCSTLPSIRNNFLLHPYKNVFYVLFFSHKLTPTSNHALLATIASSISSHFRYTHTILNRHWYSNYDVMNNRRYSLTWWTRYRLLGWFVKHFLKKSRVQSLRSRLKDSQRAIYLHFALFCLFFISSSMQILNFSLPVRRINMTLSGATIIWQLDFNTTAIYRMCQHAKKSSFSISSNSSYHLPLICVWLSSPLSSLSFISAIWKCA